MLSNAIKTMLTLSSISPAFLGYALKDFMERDFVSGTGWVIACWAVISLSKSLLKFAVRNIPARTVTIESVRPAEKDIFPFLVSYVLPMLSIDGYTLAFMLFLLGFIVYFSDVYSFNPFLNVLNFHIYEVTTSEKVSLLLISKGRIYKAEDVRKVRLIFEGVFLFVPDSLSSVQKNTK
ncbi:MAG: hypothetical protein WHS64_09530 [Fervidobacterium sp.]|uniref:hypothetical protein n=1 Tax=Fervidobacterium TaxID=2422 RepID=UPI0030AAC166